jgi:uncharacterized protein
MLAVFCILSSGIPSFDRRTIVRNTFIVEGLIALLPCVIYLIALGYAYLTDTPPGTSPWAQLHWSWSDVGWGCLAAMPPLLVIWLIDLFPIGPLRKVKDISDQFLRPLLKDCRLPDFFILATLAGFCEELLFRGWLQPMLSQYVDLPYSILITGIIFGLCHFITVTYVIIAFLISVYLSWLLVWSDNLLVPMVTHGVYDLIALIVVMWPRKGERDGRLGGEAPVPFDQGGGDVRRGEQAEEFPGGLPAGEQVGEIGKLSRPGEPALRGKESSGSEGVP